MQAKNTIEELVCSKCSYSWFPRVGSNNSPKECPNCKSRNWLKEVEDLEMVKYCFDPDVQLSEASKKYLNNVNSIIEDFKEMGHMLTLRSRHRTNYAQVSSGCFDFQDHNHQLENNFMKNMPNLFCYSYLGSCTTS